VQYEDRSFEIDVLACPGCGGRLRLLATIEEPEMVRKILSHLGIPTECPEALPARAPPPWATPDFPALFGARNG
jgi:uncharacterized protein YbaR (Trm112 family)